MAPQTPLLSLWASFPESSAYTASNMSPVGHDPCTTTLVHACTRIIAHACTTVMVHACPKIIVHACQMLIVHARTMIIVNIYYDKGTCVYYDRTTCMYYDRSTCIIWGEGLGGEAPRKSRGGRGGRRAPNRLNMDLICAALDSRVSPVRGGVASAKLENSFKSKILHNFCLTQ